MEFGYNVESWEISEIYLRGGIRDIEAICYVRFCRTISSFFSNKTVATKSKKHDKIIDNSSAILIII